MKLHITHWIDVAALVIDQEAIILRDNGMGGQLFTLESQHRMDGEVMSVEVCSRTLAEMLDYCNRLQGLRPEKIREASHIGHLIAKELFTWCRSEEAKADARTEYSVKLVQGRCA